MFLLALLDVNAQTDQIAIYKNGKRIVVFKNDKGLYNYDKRIDFYFKKLTLKDTLVVSISNSIFDIKTDSAKYEFTDTKGKLLLRGYSKLDSKKCFVLKDIDYQKLMKKYFAIRLYINDVKSKYIVFIVSK